MKLLPILLLNLATVAVGLFVYEQVRSEPAAPPTETADAEPAFDGTAFEQRLAALEAARQPTLRVQGPDTGLLARLEALERNLAQLAEERGSEAASAAAATPKAEPAEPFAGLADEPTPEAVERFRKLQAAVKRNERIERERKRIDQTLRKLGITLSKAQRAKLAAAHVSFVARRNEIWTEAKQSAAQGGSPDWKTVISETQARIQREFATRIARFVPESDAEAIAGALHGGK